MCKVGGPRCEMSHSARANWGAKRKARNAYRKAMAAHIAKATNNPALEKTVKNMNMADINELAAYIGVDKDKVAVSCGTQTYTSPDGETVTLDVTADNTARRTPVTREGAEAKLAILTEMAQKQGVSWKPDTPYWNAVLYGDVEAQKSMAKEVEEAGIEAEELLKNAATDEEVSDAFKKIDLMAHTAAGQCADINSEHISGVASDAARAMQERGIDVGNPKFASDALKDINPTLYDSIKLKEELGGDSMLNMLATMTTKELEEYSDDLREKVENLPTENLSTWNYGAYGGYVDGELRKRNRDELTQEEITLANIAELARRGASTTNPEVTEACLSGLAHTVYSMNEATANTALNKRMEQTLHDVQRDNLTAHSPSGDKGQRDLRTTPRTLWPRTIGRDDIMPTDEDIKNDPIVHYNLRKTEYYTDNESTLTPLGSERGDYNTFIYSDPDTGNLVEATITTKNKNLIPKEAEREEYASVLAAGIPPLVREDAPVARVTENLNVGDFTRARRTLDDLDLKVPDDDTIAFDTQRYTIGNEIRCAKFLRDNPVGDKQGKEKLDALINRARAHSQIAEDMGIDYVHDLSKDGIPYETVRLADARFHRAVRECAAYADELDKKNGTSGDMTYSRALDIVSSSGGSQGWGYHCAEPGATHRATDETIRRIREGAAAGTPLDDLEAANPEDVGGVGHDDVVAARKKLETLLDSSEELEEADRYLPYGELCVNTLSHDRGESTYDYRNDYPARLDNRLSGYTVERGDEGRETHAQTRIAAAVRRYYDPRGSRERLKDIAQPSIAEPTYYSVNTDTLPPISEHALADLAPEADPMLSKMDADERDPYLADDAYSQAYDIFGEWGESYADGENTDEIRKTLAVMNALDDAYDRHAAGDTNASHQLVNLYGTLYEMAANDRDMVDFDMSTHQYVDPNQGSLF